MEKFQLKLLGKAELHGHKKSNQLERKTAGLLAYLALEGSSHRQALASLLWPDSSEKQARTNLRKVLSRLKPFGPIITGQDILTLIQGLEVDALETQAKLSDLSMSELLADYYYDDCPDFMDWLLLWRERLREEKLDYLITKAHQLEAQNKLPDALIFAKQLIQHEPMSEVHYRRLMRLQFLLGDRAAALDTYHRCQAALKTFLGLEPAPQTILLAKQIEQLSFSKTVAPSFSHLPLKVLRPPLVGRESNWKQLEAAWSKNQIPLIVGEGGTGKSRLAQEFLAQQETVRFNATGHAGDKTIPYAPLSRLFKPFNLNPDSFSLLQNSALSRLLPELSTSVLDTSVDDLLKTFITVLKAQNNHSTLICDDLHLWDKASVEFILKLAQDLTKTPQNLRLIICYRPNELLKDHEQKLDALADQASLIHLSALTKEEIETLLDKLELVWVEVTATDLFHLSKGNPFLIVETLKGFQQLKASQALPNTIDELFKERFLPLPERAKQLLWVLCLTGGTLDIELAAAMLRSKALALSESIISLTKAQFLDTSESLHDLLSDAILKTIPPAIKQLLHNRAAHYLSKPEPLQAAEHWLATGKLDNAAEHWLLAAKQLYYRGLIHEPIAVLERALSYKPVLEEELAALLARLYSEAGEFEKAYRLAHSLEKKVEAPRTKAQVLYVLTDTLMTKGTFKAAAAKLSEGEALANYLQDESLQDDFLNMNMNLSNHQGNYELSLDYAEALLQRYRARPSSTALATILSNIGTLHTSLNKIREGLPYHYEAKALATKLQLQSQMFTAAGNLAVAHYMLEEPQKAIELSLEALEVGHFHGYDTIRNNLAFLYMDAGNFDKAIVLSKELADTGELPQDRLLAQARLSELYTLSKKEAEIIPSLDKAIALANNTDLLEPRVRVIINTLKYGSKKQKTLVLEWLNALDLKTIRHDHLEELKELNILPAS